MPHIVKSLLALLGAFFITSCTSTQQQQLLGSIANGDVKTEVKSLLKQKKQIYKERPEQFVADVQNVKALLEQLAVNVSQIWGRRQVSLPSNKRFVKYTNNYKARAIVDFDEGILRVETIASSQPGYNLEQAIVTTLLATSNPQETDIFSSKAPLPTGKPFLYKQIRDHDNQPIQYLWRAKRFAKYLVKHKRRTHVISKGQLHFVDVPLVSEHRHLRKRRYSQFVLNASRRYQVSPSLIYGVIETESSFNPFAVSHANAYGLMQVVASTAGKDVYERVKNRPGQPSRQVLFDPEQNIDIGTAYLSMLDKRYLKNITHPQSRYYSVISAYNGGAGNVLRTFSSDRKAAVKHINRLSSQQVYDRLTTHHPRAESRRYLHKVNLAEKKYRL